MKICAVIVAAGSSSRMKSEKSKILLDLSGKTVIRRTAEAFEKSEIVSSIVIVTREDDKKLVEVELKGITKLHKIVNGGNDRQESVYNGVIATKDCDVVMIHDGARPLIEEKDIEKVCHLAIDNVAASLAVKVKDTIKETDDKNFVVGTPNRDFLWQVQTPQVFLKSLYLEAVKKAKTDGKSYTDDCQLIESIGRRVVLCEGSYRNIKITTSEDMIIAKAFVKESV